MEELEPIVVLFLIIWFAFFGACIGSFLNVVVYRLPLGKSLSKPPSFCPRCGHPIRWYDNIPVFAWLALGGKCRDCRVPISIRYPLVEFAAGAVFGFTAEWVCRSFAKISVTEFFLLTSSLSGFIVTFGAAVLIYYDGKPVPWRYFLAWLLILAFIFWATFI